jgi:hypothetical protein
MWSPQFRAAHQTGTRSLGVPPQRTVRQFVTALVSQETDVKACSRLAQNHSTALRQSVALRKIRGKTRLKTGTGFSTEETFLLAMKIAAGRTRTCLCLRLRVADQTTIVIV